MGLSVVLTELEKVSTMLKIIYDSIKVSFKHLKVVGEPFIHSSTDSMLQTIQTR